MEDFQDELMKQVEELKNELNMARNARKAVEKRLPAAEEKLNRAAIMNDNGRDNRTQSPDVRGQGVSTKYAECVQPGKGVAEKKCTYLDTATKENQERKGQCPLSSPNHAEKDGKGKQGEASAADVLARLPADDSDDYDQVKETLLKRFHLSAEAFRQRFRSLNKRQGATFAEFAYELKVNLAEWLKGAKAFGSFEKALEVFALEQFYSKVPEAMKLWIQDRDRVESVQSAADLADQYASRRGIKEEATIASAREKRGWEGTAMPSNGKDAAEEVEPKVHEQPIGEQEREIREKRSQKSLFGERRPVTCFNCNETGHIAVGCRKPRVVFAYVSDSQTNDELLKSHLSKLQVNGKSCNVLRDSGATIDLVHPDYVKQEQYNGKCAWIKPVLEDTTVCLPVADVVLSGPFGEVCTEAAVSNKLPPQYTYLFSNRTDRLLRDQGKDWVEGSVPALTTSKARALAAKLEMKERDTDVEVSNPLGDECEIEPENPSVSVSSEGETVKHEREIAENAAVKALGQSGGQTKFESTLMKDVECVDGLFVLPCSSSLDSMLAKVTREVLMKEQTVNLALNMTEEVATEIPCLSEMKEITGAKDVMRVAASREALTDLRLADPNNLVEENMDLFSQNPGKTELMAHDTELASETPVKSRAYRTAPRQQEMLKREIERMLELRIIEPCESFYASPLILVEVPGKDPPPSTEYRKLNATTKDQMCPIPQYSEQAAPLTDALRKSALERVIWDDAKGDAFQGLKAALSASPVLRAPNYDRPSIVQCDAGNRGLGVVLCQEGDNGEEHPVLCASRKLTSHSSETDWTAWLKSVDVDRQLELVDWAEKAKQA
ncbi:uncharacterized protein [Dermacentor albipictus]|uniref:uncharacterized protein n=1 Tax=Dermacentor albipictus TaxID=60249 RepID=UPI0038FC2D6C